MENIISSKIVPLLISQKERTKIPPMKLTSSNKKMRDLLIH